MVDKALMQMLDMIEMADPNMCIVVTDQLLDLPGPHILYVNKKWQEVTGYNIEEVIGKTPRILQGPGSDRATLNQLKESLQSGETFAGSTINYRKDGTPILMSWVVVGPINANYFVGLQKVTVKQEAMEQLRLIKEIQASILKKLNEVLPLNTTS